MVCHHEHYCFQCCGAVIAGRGSAWWWCRKHQCTDGLYAKCPEHAARRNPVTPAQRAVGRTKPVTQKPSSEVPPLPITGTETDAT